MFFSAILFDYFAVAAAGTSQAGLLKFLRWVMYAAPHARYSRALLRNGKVIFTTAAPGRQGLALSLSVRAERDTKMNRERARERERGRKEGERMESGKARLLARSR